MRAFLLTGHGGLDRYRFVTGWPIPEPGPKEVRVRVHACGLNTVDVNTRVGWYAREVQAPTQGEGFGVEVGTWSGRVRFPLIQGSDIVGVVDRVGEGADPRLLGRRVVVDNWIRDPEEPWNPMKARYVGSEVDGGFADYCVVPEANVVPVESPLPSVALATLACSGTTAEGMLERAGVGEGDWVLVTGASGGVGVFLVQLAKLRKARVVALASPEKHEALRALGADVCLPRSPENLPKALEAATGRPHVDAVADVVGGSLFPALLEALRPGGAYVTSGAIAGPKVDLDLRDLYLRNLTLRGSGLVPPEILRRLVRYVEEGRLSPVVAGVWPLERLPEAQAAFLEKRHVGKLVVYHLPEALEPYKG
ncbi:alcohol dehydrogenase family protein [Thermus thermophilus]|uniref:Alcohol dehydrogenase n=1 Tax=Thermus thermophilus TaxID=274 RepID=A0AAD1KW96_THETH|nr:alcohol dehydrogenase family protein [Thermus thermophilus]BBL83221.1 alcohol dehydrogenase [Thermus thermophilus]BBL85520.1 alcohol dehydrogenase [Thermus thermophilus]BCZ87867.1 alcohol dehydrogenase [Thermus thermophilus]